MNDQPNTDLISVPKGGGALSGIGETFQPDLHTGTGNLTVPLELPPGRNGLQPSLALSYSTGNPNGPYGLGWDLPVPGVRRKTDKGIPRYDPALDTFVLSGAEDLVPISSVDSEAVRYRPRNEVGYARIIHMTGACGDYWEVWSTDGLRSRYGAPQQPSPPLGWADPAVIADPNRPGRIFAWLLTETIDPVGNRIFYSYRADPASTAQRYLSEISYADYGNPASPQFLVTVKIIPDPQPRPDPFSDHRPGFDLRTTQRTAAIETWTQAGDPVLARRVELSYADQTGTPPANSVSLLTRVAVTGLDGDGTQALPPLELRYTPWDPLARRYQPLSVASADLPATSLAGRGIDLVDMFGDGLVSILQLNGTARYWRNRGDGSFDPPRSLAFAPAGVNLGDPGVQLADFDGDGRPDLLVSTPDRTGYWPLASNGGFDPAGYVPVRDAPTVSLSDPLIRLIDLDGDGITDALRTSDRFELIYSSNGATFSRIQVVQRGDDVPDVTFGDPRVLLADMSGDGLTDLVLAHDGNITYWPYQGYGTWGAKVVMHNPPRFSNAAAYPGAGFDPQRLLLGDVDGDGCADIVYVADGTVTVWINQAGNGFADPVTIRGTPRVAGASLRLADIYGAGTAGVMWTYDLGSVRGSSYKFLDLTGGTKPYLLNQIDNHAGATTTITYSTSTACAIADRAAGRPWKATLPFPVHVVAHTIVTDYFSGTALTSEYLYHHGYWDGADREFRGFARVDQRDTLTPTRSAPAFYSPPTETRTWFHPGPVGSERGAWTEGLDLSDEYWPGDPPLTDHIDVSALPAGIQRRSMRYAIRALKGRVLRSELYALDGDPNADRPYQISDYAYALAPVLDGRPVTDPGWQAAPVVAVQPTARRTTIWERSTDPMTQATLTGGYDDYGRPHQTVAIAVSRGRDPHVTSPAGADPYLATMTLTDYATRDDATHYLIGRPSVQQRFELAEDTAAGGAALITFGRQQLASPPQPAAGTIRSLTLTYYDGPAFEGMPSGQLGDWGLRTRVERLSLTPEILTAAYGAEPPPYLGPGTPPWTAEYPAAFRDAAPPLGGYQYHDATGPYLAGWYAQDERVTYDVQQAAGGRGLVTARRDPLGNDTVIGYDGYQLLPARVTDPAGLTRTASYDYRVLRPVLVTDPNGNQSACGYTPLGLPAWLANTGQPGANEGDTPAQPGTMFAYDLTAWDDSPADRQPMSVRTTRRVDHRWTLVDAANAQRAAEGLPLTDAQIAAMFPPDEVGQYADRFIQKAEFTDGFGRLMQTRAQADDTVLDDLGLTADMITAPGPVRTHQVDPTAPPQVVVSGWQAYDNKGRIVEKYEPAFDTGWAYQPPATATQAKVVTSYDPRGLAVRTVYPDGSEQLLVPGIPPDLTDPGSYRPTPWETFTYDNNDNAGRTRPATSAAWSSHWNTPSSDLVDALGRVIEHAERAVAGTAPIITRSAYDIDGNLLTVTDALGRAASLQVYDLQGRSWRRQLIDAGVTRVVLDAAGGTLERRDASGAMRLAVTDTLLRPLQLWARDTATGTPTLRGAFVYGDDAAQSGLSGAAAAAANLLGRPYWTYDEAGRVETAGYDLDGNLLEKTRSTLAASVIVAALPGPAANWSDAAYQADWQPAAGQTIDQHASPLLDATPYTVSTAYDALGRPTSVTAPLDADGTRKILLPAYSRSGALTALTVDGVACVTQILYNARGQRALAVLGCGVMIRYVYDPLTFRLARLRSESATGAAPPVQDYGYTYDFVGNVLSLHDRTPGSGISPAPDQLDRAFAYDPLYRLTSATGRECDVPPPTPWADTPRCTDLTQVRAYTEAYGYDLVGSLLKLGHYAASGNFVRSYDIPAAGNQVTGMVTGSTTYGYGYDACGNLVNETTSRRFEWNHAGQLATFRTQTPNSEPSLYAEYRYDGSGRRVLKVVRKQGGQLTVTVYIGGLFERTTLTGTSNHDTLHILDGAARVAVIRAGPPLPGDASPPTAYHLADHLGSSTVVLDGSGAFVNREEYTPYGETSFGSYALKRYRYTGKERDEESGLYYFGARYHCPWLARWTSTDPSPKPAWSGYRYAADNPLAFTDPSGAQEQSAPSAGVLSTPLETGTAGEGSGPVQFVPQEGGGYTSGPPPTPPSTDPADAGTRDAGDSEQKTGETSEESHGPEFSAKISAKTSIGGSTTKADNTTSETKPAKGSPLKVSAELNWSAIELEEPGLKTESKSYNEFSETGTWSKVTVGSASAHLITAGLSLEGPTLSLLDAQATAVTAEYGGIAGHWYGGLTGTATVTAAQANTDLGLEKGSVKAEVGITFGTARIKGGFNLLGLNVSIFGEVTAGVKLGVSAGEETSVKAGFVGVGLAFGAAKSSEARAGWLNFMEDMSKAIPEWLQFTGAQNTPFFGGF